MTAECGRMIGAPEPDGAPSGTVALWRQCPLRALGTPALVVGALGVIWAAHRAAGSVGLIPIAEMEAFFVLLGLGVIVLICPPRLLFRLAELSEGLAARRPWKAMPPEERTKPAPLAKPNGGGRRRAPG